MIPIPYSLYLPMLKDFLMQYGHIPILGLLAWIGYALHRHGVKMTFDIRIWKNGKDKKHE